MKVGVFYPSGNLNHKKMLQGFAQGINETKEDEADFNDLKTYDPDNDYDICVVFGVYKSVVANSVIRGYVIKSEKAKDKDFIVVERGYIKRDEYYSIGLNGLNNRALFNNYGSSSDRFSSLGVQLKPWKENDDGYILLIGQVPWDASVDHSDHRFWLTHAVKTIKEFTDRPIIFRPHPLSFGNPQLEKRAIHSITGTTRSTGKLDNDLASAYCVVTFNSNTGVDAVLEGIPTFCFDPGSMIYPYGAVGLQYIENLEHIKKWNREKWANNLAYAQWNLQEMKQGKPWNHLRNLIIDRKLDIEDENYA